MVRRPPTRATQLILLYFLFLPRGSHRPCCAAHAPSNARRAGVAVMQAPRGVRTVAVTLPGCHHPVRRTAPSRVSCWPAARRFAGGSQAGRFSAKYQRHFGKKIYYNKDFILRLHDPSAATGGVRARQRQKSAGRHMKYRQKIVA